MRLSLHGQRACARRISQTSSAIALLAARGSGATLGSGVFQMQNLSEFLPAIGDGSYVAARQPVLTDERWRWLCRQHKNRFIEANAAVLIGGRIHLHPERTDATILELGREQAARHAEVL
jgi:hypothetical protein